MNDQISFMSTDFFYFDNATPVFPETTRRVVVPTGYVAASELFGHILRSLGFRESFVDHYSVGPNWDRINDLYLGQELDCLKGTADSTATEQDSQVVLVHQELPNLHDDVLGDDRVRAYYISWCDDQIRNNDEEDSDLTTHKLMIAFPESSRSEITRLMTMPLS